MSREQCQQCRFWDRYVDGGPSALNALVGDCRRNPPPISEQILARTMPGYSSEQLDDLELNVYAASAFPVTHEESWCGQFEVTPATLDDPIIAAWKTFSAIELAGYIDASPAVAASIVLLREEATSIAGIIAKLRSALYSAISDTTIEEAILSERPLLAHPAGYRERLINEDYTAECIWTAITSLERLAGQDALPC